jgi:hypothetical protein
MKYLGKEKEKDEFLEELITWFPFTTIWVNTV